MTIFKKILVKFYKYINDKPMDLHDFIQNNSISLLNEINEIMISVEIVLAAPSSHHSFDKHFIKLNNINDNYTWKVVDQPLETIGFYNYNDHINILKCFTFFSHSNTDWREMNLAYDYIKVDLKYDFTKSPHVLPNRFALSIHSQNSLPQYGMFKIFRPGLRYFVGYSRWKIERLGSQYYTDCREYDPTQLTWNDCVYQCYQDTVTYGCQKNGIVLVDIFLRTDYFKNKTLSNCTRQEGSRKITVLKCMEMCQKECHYSNYPFVLNILNDIDFTSNSFYIRHNEMPDLDIRHIPEMPLMTLICDFGGLLGMWLGVSFLTILSDLLKTMRKFVNTKILINKQAVFNIRNPTIEIIKIDSC